VEERLQKFLSECGVASRRGSEQLIRDGCISVNDLVIRDMGIKVNPETDVVKYKGKIVRKCEISIYLIMNKPIGYVTTVKDEFNRPKVIDLLKGIDQKVYPVGRLDYNSSGLLLLTNDGKLTYKLTHPGHEVNKKYLVRVKGNPDINSINRLRKGVIIDGYLTSPAKISIIYSDKGSTVLEFIIHEGRNRQIRKMCSFIGNEVISLKRVSVGELSLGDLKDGQWRYLTESEVDYLISL
jgi:23S rRNA pseudouridine2605 synthase